MSRPIDHSSCVIMLRKASNACRDALKHAKNVSEQFWGVKAPSFTGELYAWHRLLNRRELVILVKSILVNALR